MIKQLVLMLILAALFVGALYFNAAPPPPESGKRPAPKYWETPECREAIASWSGNGLAGVAVVAPGSGLKMEDTKKAYRMAETIGLSLPAEALKPGVVPYTANDDAERVRLFVEALGEPGVDVLWALRGGYGSGRLLETLAGMERPARRKIFVGYSDVTFLHQLFQRWGWPSVHGAMFWELSAGGKDPRNVQLLTSLLSGAETDFRYDGLKAFNKAAEGVSGSIEGVLRGGNLTCLAAGLGTPWGVEVGEGDGVILFIEDVSEPGYKVDRMLTQLGLAGVFEHVRAVLLGTFSKGDGATEFALERFFGSLEKPVFRADLFGHGSRNYPLVFNVPSVIVVGEGEGAELRIDAAGLRDL